jgi:hypothetical protein
MHDDHDHDHDDHDHSGHDHEHPHAPRRDHDAGPAGAYEILEEAVRTLLIEKGVLTAQEIAASVDVMDSRSPALGAKVVARAWTDPAFKKLLLTDTRAALKQMGIEIGPAPEFATVENTRRCTTSSSARCAPAIPRCCSASRLPGTRAWPTAPARSWTRAACSPSSASRFPPT